MKKENAVRYLSTLVSDIKLDTHNVTTHYSMLVILGNYDKESGEHNFLSASFSPVNFDMKDGIIIKSTQKRKIPYLIVNILRNSMVILSYPETWGSEKKIPREWDDYSHQGSALLTTAAAMCNRVLDFGLLRLQLWLHWPCMERLLSCVWFSYSFHRYFSLRS